MRREKVKCYLLVYPDDLYAKVFRLGKDGFEKEGDFSRESYRFEEAACRPTIDFDRVFRRFRKKK